MAGAVALQQDLDLLPGDAIDNRRVLARVDFVAITDLAGIEDIAEELAQVITGKPLATSLASMARAPALGPPAARLPWAQCCVKS
jgi:hypothetical protein